MKTRPASIPAEVPDSIDYDALQIAMKAHPVVVDAINRVATRARTAEAATVTAAGERDTEIKSHKATKTKLEVTQGVLDTYTGAFGKTPPAAVATSSLSGQAHELTDAEVEEIVGKMSASEKAMVMMKATPASRFTLDSPAQSGDVFRK